MKSISLPGVGWCLALVAAAGILSASEPSPIGGNRPPHDPPKKVPFLLRHFDAPDAVYALAFTPDGKGLLSAGSGGRGGTLHLWEVSTGKLLRGWIEHKFTANAVAVAPDGKRAATGDRDGVIVVYDLNENRPLHKLMGHKSWVNRLEFVAGGSELLSIGGDRVIHRWDVAEGASKKKFATVEFADIALSPVGNHAVSIVDSRRGLALLNLETGFHKLDFAKDLSNASVLTISPDGGSVVAALGTTHMSLIAFDLSTGKQRSLWTDTPQRYTESFGHVAYTPNGMRLAAIRFPSQLQLFDAEGPKLLRTYESSEVHKPKISAFAITPDGRFAATADESGRICLWDIASGFDDLRLRGHEGLVCSVDHQAEQKWILSAGQDKTARLWDAATGKELQVFGGHGGRVNVARFLPPRGEEILTAGQDGEIRIWNSRMGRAVKVLRGHTRPVRCVAVVDGGKRLLSAGGEMILVHHPQVAIEPRDCVIRLWSAESGEILQRFEGHTAPVIALALLEGERQFLSASEDQTVRRWDLDTGEELERMEKHVGDITAFALSPDFSTAASVDIFGVVWCWDLKKGTAVENFKGPSHPIWGQHGDYFRKRQLIRSLAYSPDGRRLIFGMDGGVVIRDAQSGQKLDEFLIDGWVDAVACAEGNAVLFGGSDKVVRRWLPAAK